MIQSHCCSRRCRCRFPSLDAKFVYMRKLVAPKQSYFLIYIESWSCYDIIPLLKPLLSLQIPFFGSQVRMCPHATNSDIIWIRNSFVHLEVGSTKLPYVFPQFWSSKFMRTASLFPVFGWPSTIGFTCWYTYQAAWYEDSSETISSCCSI